MAFEKKIHHFDGDVLSSPVARRIVESIQSLAVQSGIDLVARDAGGLLDELPEEIVIDDEVVLGNVSRYGQGDMPAGLVVRAIWYNDAGRTLAQQALGDDPVVSQLDFRAENNDGNFAGVLRPAILESDDTILTIDAACIVTGEGTEEVYQLYRAASAVGIQSIFRESTHPLNLLADNQFSGHAPEDLGRDLANALVNLARSDPRPLNP